MCKTRILSAVFLRFMVTVKDTLAYVRSVIDTEINSATDNPKQCVLMKTL